MIGWLFCLFLVSFLLWSCFGVIPDLLMEVLLFFIAKSWFAFLRSSSDNYLSHFAEHILFLLILFYVVFATFYCLVS